MPPRKRRPRGHIEKLPSGSFRTIVYGGADPLTGKERRLKATARSYAEAEVALTQLQRQVDEETHPKTALTIGQAIAQWLEVAKLGETTRERYDDLIRIYIDPAFGDVLAAKLDAEMLERFYARLQLCRELCGSRRRAGHTCRPLSGSTVRKIHFIVSGALELAVRWRHVGVNRAAMARAPSPSRPEPDPPSAAEAAALLNAAWADPDWGLLLWLTMVTGLRRGEVSALRWSHVDVDRGCLLVQRANAQPKAGVLEKETKTGQQRRVALDQGNAASLGRAIAAVESKATTLTQTAVTTNNAVKNSGGVYRKNGTMNTTNSPITANSANNCTGSSPAVPTCTAWPPSTVDRRAGRPIRRSDPHLEKEYLS